MKKLFTTVITIFLCLSLQAQWSKPDWSKIAWSMGGQIASIGLEMSGDALRDMGKASGNQSQINWGHTLKATGYVVPFITNTILVWNSKDNGHKLWEDITIQVVTYGLNRFATADLFYNTVHPEYNLLDVGTVSKYDNIMSKMPPGGRAWYKGVSFGLGFAITINYWRK